MVALFFGGKWTAGYVIPSGTVGFLQDPGVLVERDVVLGILLRKIQLDYIN